MSTNPLSAPGADATLDALLDELVSEARYVERYAARAIEFAGYDAEIRANVVEIRTKIHALLSARSSPIAASESMASLTEDEIADASEMLRIEAMRGYSPAQVYASALRRARRAEAPSAASEDAGTPDASWFGCLTGDCPHELQGQCDAAIRAEFVRLTTALARAERNQGGSEDARIGTEENSAHRCPTCRALCCCAEWYDGQACRHTANVGCVGEDARDAARDGVSLIAAERRRQIEKEGWTPAHDDTHVNGELAVGAACYAMPSTLRRHYKHEPLEWKWAACDWKPTPDDRVRELVKAGALIAAEIDRLHRARMRG